MLYTIDINTENKHMPVVKLLLQNKKSLRLRRVRAKKNKEDSLMKELEKSLMEVKLMSENKIPKRKLKTLLNGK